MSCYASVIWCWIGIQEKLLHRGEGTVRPGQEDNCLVHYQGALLDCEARVKTDSLRSHRTPKEDPKRGIRKTNDL